MSFLANKGKAQTSATPTAPAARQPGRYTGLRSNDDKAPRLVKGNYVVEIVSTKTVDTFEKGKLWIGEVNVLESEPGSGNMPGPASIFGSRKSGKAEKMTFPRVKRLCVTATGFDNDGDFEAEYPNWEDLFDRVLGEKIVEEAFGENPLAGAKIRIMVTDGQNRDEAGNPYPNYAFAPYSEEA